MSRNPRKSSKSAVQKKTYNLDSSLIERVRGLYNVRTETEAIQKALSTAVETCEIEESLEQLLKVGRFRTIYR
jgi:hypothetical protein